jgi:hypothetical protein
MLQLVNWPGSGSPYRHGCVSIWTSGGEGRPVPIAFQIVTATNFATADDFATWAARAKSMTVAALLYTVNDCHQAAEAMRGWNPIKEGFYIDQACTYGMELTRRRRQAA